MSAAAARKKVRPNAARRAAYRMALTGRTCATCDLPVVFDGQDDVSLFHAGTATLGHVVAVEVCMAFNTTVVDVQCWACNSSANYAGVLDQTSAWNVRPYSLPSQTIADAWRAVEVYGDASGLPGHDARRAARAARGIAW